VPEKNQEKKLDDLQNQQNIKISCKMREKKVGQLSAMSAKS